MKIVRYPSKTYKVAKEEVLGFTTDIRQSIYNILNTERYQHPIYSGNYGVSLVRFIGKNFDYIKAELPREVSEALMWDDRITGVSGFDFQKEQDRLVVKFIVHTIGGDEPFVITQSL